MQLPCTPAIGFEEEIDIILKTKNNLNFNAP